jgi:hypothetical protein
MFVFERAPRVMGGGLGVIGGNSIYVNKIIYPPSGNKGVHIHKKKRSPRWLFPRSPDAKRRRAAFPLPPKTITEETAAPNLRGWWCCYHRLSLSSLYSPVAAVKVVLPRELHLDRRACGESTGEKRERAGRAFRGLQAFTFSYHV